MLKDKDATRRFKKQMTHKTSEAICEVVQSYIAAFEKCTILKLRTEGVAIKITVEFGDADEIEYEDEMND